MDAGLGATPFQKKNKITTNTSTNPHKPQHNLVGNVAAAVGALLGGALVTLLTTGSTQNGPLNLSDYQAYRAVIISYSLIGLGLLLIFSALSPAVEAPTPTTAKPTPVKQFLGLHTSKWLVLRLALLFCIDSFAGGFILQSLLANWFSTTWHTKPAGLGAMLFMCVCMYVMCGPCLAFASLPSTHFPLPSSHNTHKPTPKTHTKHSCNLVAGISALFAAHLAKLIGLIQTMVFTHLPSNVMMILVPLMPTQLAAAALLSLRSCISQMDVPTRNRY